MFFQNLWHLFEHVTESKNHVIESLLKELDESEEQYARNFSSHAETIDQLIGMYSQCHFSLNKSSGTHSDIKFSQRGVLY
jgi:uncharacterized membrane-anchored protein YhcB (DUF1043 family)